MALKFDLMRITLPKMAPSFKVAVIGAGPAGLAVARELQREGQQVVVYEKADQIGGIWVYNPQVEADPLCLDPDRKIIHSSLYRSLRANLPIQLMGFSDYPFRISKHGELRNFTGHEEVLKFLNNFARDFALLELIKFNNEVVRVEQVSSEDEHWVVESKTSDEQSSSEEIFDAVVVCNGHYTQPKVAELPGNKKWPGKQVHSHNYRVPEPYEDQIVVVIGAGPSAHDIAQEIAKVAKEVHISSRSPEIKVSKFENFDNLWQHSKIEYCHENGEVAFEDGASVVADVILHCTGYKYEFPFLKTNGIVTVDNNRVGPLYKHVFPPELAPALSFVGIPNRAINFRMTELQAKWIARVLSRKVLLPSKEEMLAAVEEHYQLMVENGVPKHHTHTLPIDMFKYLDWVAAEAGEPPMDEQQKEIIGMIVKSVRISWVGVRERVNGWISSGSLQS